MPVNMAIRREIPKVEKTIRNQSARGKKNQSILGKNNVERERQRSLIAY